MRNVACERVFAWRPLQLREGGGVWLQSVYRVYVYDSNDWDMYYTLILPRDAL